ncbi:hypothetical protein IWQ61_001267 [Dispira simplex]|nr:hypothetical protein IWQ61_001267 [Dispira simplex]
MAHVDHNAVDLSEKADILDVTALVNDYGWQPSGGAAALEEKLLQELNGLEKNTVRSVISADRQVGSITSELENGYDHLELILNWLRGYDYELDSMEQDVLEIQAQNELLKVEEKNQQRLLEELEYLLYTITIPQEELNVLLEESLESNQGLHKIEIAAGRIQRMVDNTLDPQFQAMRATQERLDTYRYHATTFSARVSEFLKVMFQYNVKMVMSDSVRGRGKLAPAPGVIVKPTGPAAVQDALLKYRSMVLWLKQMEPNRYRETRMVYVHTMGELYENQIKDLVNSVRPLMVRGKGHNDEPDHLFTSFSTPSKTAPMQLAASAVKPRRNSVSDYHSGGRDSQTRPDEVFHLAMACVIPLAISEQNYINDTFHYHTTVPFFEYIASEAPTTLEGLAIPRSREKDPLIAKDLKDMMGLTFSSLGSEIPSLIDLALQCDKIHSVGMLVAVEHHMKELEASNQEFVFVVLQNMQKQLAMTFSRFIDEQLRGIDEIKVTTKRRIGVLPFFRVFPKFAKKLEDALGNSQTEARKLVSLGYDKIVRTMFNRLLTIGREADMTNHQTDDRDAVKEQLNAHILTIENMYYFYTALRATDIPVLKRYIEQAQASLQSAMQAYVKTVVRRPLGRLLEFFEGVEGLLKTEESSEISYHLPYNQAALHKVLGQYRGEELHRNIQALQKRVEKHFPEGGPLRSLVRKEIYLEMVHQHDRFASLIRRCYPQEKMTVGFTAVDLQRWCDS